MEARNSRSAGISSTIASTVPTAMITTGVARVEREVVAREQAHGAGVAHGDAADAVELALEDPRRVAEACVGERRLHRGRAGRRRSGPDERALVCVEAVEPVGRRAGQTADPPRATS